MFQFFGFSNESIYDVVHWLQTFFPLGKISVMIYGALGTIVFCGYIVYDTYLLIERHSQDNDYILAAAELYLDVLNLFVSLNDLLRGGNDVCCSVDCELRVTLPS